LAHGKDKRKKDGKHSQPTRPKIPELTSTRSEASSKRAVALSLRSLPTRKEEERCNIGTKHGDSKWGNVRLKGKIHFDGGGRRQPGQDAVVPLRRWGRGASKTENNQGGGDELEL